MNAKNIERTNGWICAAAAIAVGIFAGLVDFHNNEPQPAAAVLLVSGALLGFARPRGAWRWGVIAALGIPAVYLAGGALGFKPIDVMHPNIFASLVALIPAMIGVYAGALIKKLFVRQSAR
jgi:hypothetical protein